MRQRSAWLSVWLSVWRSRPTWTRLGASLGARLLSRRRFLSFLLGASVAALVASLLAACRDRIPRMPAVQSTDGAGGEEPPVFKDPTPFIERDRAGLETRLELLRDVITPTSHSFVRNNSRSIGVKIDDWTLDIGGDGVANPMRLTYDEILGLPSRTLVSYLECAGNQRVMFDRVQGRAATGTQWGRGAVSNAEWTGVSLADVLTLAGISGEAEQVMLIGLDVRAPEQGFRRAMPIAKAMDPDTILAYQMNGESLPWDHGFPLRAIAPGWVGASQIKWLGQIVVSTEPVWSRNNTTSYVLIGDEYEPDSKAHGKALGEAITEQTIKSTLALAWPAELPAGRRDLHGFAHSPHGPIALVEWSDDGGSSWRQATVLEPQPDYSWAMFTFAWDAGGGEHTIMTRATDSEGHTQPDSIPFNEKGYLFNQPLPHPISVV